MAELMLLVTDCVLPDLLSFPSSEKMLQLTPLSQDQHSKGTSGDLVPRGGASRCPSANFLSSRWAGAEEFSLMPLQGIISKCVLENQSLLDIRTTKFLYENQVHLLLGEEQSFRNTGSFLVILYLKMKLC